MMQFTNLELDTLIMLREKYGIKNAVLDNLIHKLLVIREENRRQAREYWRKTRKLSSEKKTIDTEDSRC